MSVPANKQVICEVLKEAVRRDPNIVVLCSDSRGSGSMTSFFEEEGATFCLELYMPVRRIVSQI